MNKSELKKISQEYAKKKGFSLQPDPVKLDLILEGLLNREKVYGFRYCPCRRVTGDPEEDKKIICPCIYHEDEVKHDGQCKCLLFLRKEK